MCHELWGRLKAALASRGGLPYIIAIIQSKKWEGGGRRQGVGEEHESVADEIRAPPREKAEDPSCSGEELYKKLIKEILDPRGILFRMVEGRSQREGL